MKRSLPCTRTAGRLRNACWTSLMYASVRCHRSCDVLLPADTETPAQFICEGAMSKVVLFLG